MRAIHRILFSFILIAFGLGGCTMSGMMSSVVTAVGDAGRDENTLIYDLSAPSRFSLPRRSRTIFMTIAKPTAIKSLEKNSFIVKSAGQNISVLPGVRWADKIPRLVQSRLIEAFENVGAVGSVTNGKERIQSNYSLRLNLRAFQLNAEGKSADAVVGIYVKLVENRTGEVIGQRFFTNSNHVSTDDLPDVANGFNKSFNNVAKKIVRWVVRRKVKAEM